MLMPQHGAGPMVARQFDTGKQMNPVGYRLVAHMLQRRDSLETDEANARLIAAAPTMLEALEELIGEVRETGLAVASALTKARAAIAAAKGETP
jgi:hypothetical protein